MIQAAAENFVFFPSTHWSEVFSAGQPEQEKGRKALENLLVRYEPALKTHLIARFRLTEDQAMDLLQEFVLTKVLEKNLVGRADQARGRFRTFLLSSLDNSVLGQMRRQAAQKRSPGEAILSFDEAAESEASFRLTSWADDFDVSWAREVISETLRRMQRHCEDSGRADIWGVFDGRVLGPSLGGSDPLPYEQAVERYGFQFPAQAFNVLTTGKRMFARVLRSVVAEYAADEQDVEAEIRELFAILARGRG